MRDALLEMDSNSSKNLKNAQFEIIQKTNPMYDNLGDNGNLNPNLRQRVFEVEVIESQIMQILANLRGFKFDEAGRTNKGWHLPPLICWS